MNSLEIKTVDDLVRLIQVCVWGFVIFVLMMVLGGIVASMLYSIILVGQPMKSMAPIDLAFTKMLNDIVLLIVGGIGGVIGKKGVGMVSQAIASTTEPPKPVAVAAPPQTQSGLPDFNWMGYKGPELDEKWVPPPPPATKR